MNITVPQGALYILHMLEKEGYETYVVGGCVRDSLLGISPHDWDLTTAAYPDEILRCFSKEQTISNGIEHGTVGVVLDDGVYEITSFRTEGEYTDYRHPQKVRFVRSLSEDLGRRDFTVNAMAYHPQKGLIDLFGGKQDLERKIIRCVGIPKKRYTEDALRILRAIRFASVLGFSLEAQTASEAKACGKLLEHIAEERIYEEFLRLLCGQQAAGILREYSEIVSVFLPEIKPAVGFCQHSPYHKYDVWEHTLHVIEKVPARPSLRLAALFHDLGKPSCFTLDHSGIGHFYGHADIGAQLAQTALRRLKAPKRIIREVCQLISIHEMSVLPTPANVRQALCTLGGEEPLRELIAFQRADAFAKTAAASKEQQDRLNGVEKILQSVLEQGQCYCLSMMNLNGNDLHRLGVCGKAVGKLLKELLDEVIKGNLPNERDALLKTAQNKWDFERKHCRK